MDFPCFTIRNGNIKMKDKYKKPYAEKFLYLKEGQYALNHFHCIRWKTSSTEAAEIF